MTLVFILNGRVSLDTVFPLLPITRIQVTLPKRQKKKFELPHCSTPGAMLSIRYAGETRGIIRSATGRYFKNSITIDLSTTTKNVSIKLSQSKIQMCGASSEEQGREGAQHLIDHLLRIQEELDYMKAHPEATQASRDWLVKMTQGNRVDRSTDTGEVESDFTLVPIESMEACPDPRIGAFLGRQAGDFDYHSFFLNEIDWICTLDTVATPDLSIRLINKAMVNYNYNLGFTVDRHALCDGMQYRHGFISSYDNCVEHCVKIKLPYTPTEDEGNARRKNKVPCHCFLVYRSGVVTQTGPGEERMEQAYNLFWQSILEIRDQIKVDTVPPKTNPTLHPRIVIRSRLIPEPQLD